MQPASIFGRVKTILWFMVAALAAVMLIQAGDGAGAAEADLGAELSASWEVDSDGAGTITVVVADLSEGQERVDHWSITLVEIIPSDGRGGEGGSAVDVAVFDTADAADGSLVLTFEREQVTFDYYVNLEAISQPAGQDEQPSQLYADSIRLTLD